MYPQSIVSLVPSLTELLFDLGLEDRIAGRTRFCIRPKGRVEQIPVVGGTKNPNTHKITSIGPDLIIANREENRKEDVDLLKEDFDVHLTEINTINEALFTIHDIGWKCGAGEKAKKLIREIQERMEKVPDVKSMSAAYMIWRDPWMTVGGDTYIHSVMEHWKLENIFADKIRYLKKSLEA